MREQAISDAGDASALWIPQSGQLTPEGIKRIVVWQVNLRDDLRGSFVWLPAIGHQSKASERFLALCRRSQRRLALSAAGLPTGVNTRRIPSRKDEAIASL